MKIFHKPILLGISILALISLSSFRPSEVNAQECGGPFPPKPAGVWAKSGPGGGEVTLFWQEVAYANRYAVEYGTTSGQYLYGATNIGGTSSRSYTVKSLTPGTKYYFKLAGARDCTSSPLSDEVWAWAGGGSIPSSAKASTFAPPSGGSAGRAAGAGRALGGASLWQGDP